MASTRRPLHKALTLSEARARSATRREARRACHPRGPRLSHGLAAAVAPFARNSCGKLCSARSSPPAADAPAGARALARSGARVNAKAKSRAARSAGSGGARFEPLDRVSPCAERPALAAAEGAIVFAVGAAETGERLDRFLAKRRASARLALSRTRLKALIEEGRVAVDGVAGARSRRQIGRGREGRPRRAPRVGAGPRRRRPSRSISCSRTSTSSSSTSPPASSCIPRPDIPPAPSVNALIPPLRLEPLGNRRGEAAGDRASPRQGHLRADRRRQERRRASGPRGAVRRPRARGLAHARISRPGLGRVRRRGWPVDAPIGRDPRRREKMAVVAPERAARSASPVGGSKRRSDRRP